ncbi:MAG: hypothetical protein IJ438_08735 [Clostridia bacterium]|nr:hypothetical protein [Clostridia bacterium]
MKKILSLVLCLMLLCLAGTALAAEYQPGDTVTVTVSVSSANGAVGATIKVSGDTAGLEFVSAAASVSGVAPSGNGGSFAVYSSDFVTPMSGTIGTVTFKVKDSAAAGDYKISVSCTEAYDANDAAVSMSVSGSTTVTVKAKACTEHTYDEGKVTTEPTCAAEGVKTFTCTVCKEATKTEAVAKATEHTWDEGTVTTKATCKAEGVKTFTCTVCKEATKTEAIPVDATAHTPSEDSVTVEPTCTTDGSTTGKCKDCGAEMDKVVLPATGHKWDEGTVTTAATCEGKGVKTYKCQNTGCTETKTEEIAALGHKWNDGEVTTKATCKAEGVKTFTCQNEGCTVKTKTEAIPVDATAHTPSADSVKVDPTCTVDGYVTGVCADCGTELDKEVLPATGHDLDEGKVTKEATCTADGEKTYSCSKCDYTKTEKIDALGHKSDEGKVTKEATCTEKGEKVYTCTVCNETIKTEEIAALGHKDDGGKITKEATCTEKGEKVYTCTVCNEVVKTEEIAALGHTLGDWVVIVPVTPEEPGLEGRFCSVCNAEDPIETKVIPNAVWYDMTVCSVGPHFRDLTTLTSRWDMFTPIDISADGVQTYDLIAGDTHIIGTVTVTVAEGNVTVTYDLVNKNIILDGEFLTILPSLSAVETLDQGKLTAYTFGEPISIADQLAGDTKVLLYIRNEVRYRDDILGLKDFYHKNPQYVKYVEELKGLMD